jgi:hypothetical protein
VRPTQATPSSSQNEHPVPAAWIPHPRSGDHEAIPAWPETLIPPTSNELGRWVQLWSAPQAVAWARTGQQHDVARLVRLEDRCSQTRTPPAEYVAALGFLRRELGLAPDAGVAGR